MPDFQFQRDVTHLRETFPPMAKEWNFAKLADSIRIIRDLHGWEAYQTVQRAEQSGTNLSSRTIAAPAAGFLRYVYACSGYFDGGGPLDLFIQTNNVALVQMVAVVNNQRVTIPRPIVLTENDNLNLVASAATGVGNLLLIAALHIDIPEADYIHPV